MKAKRAYLLWRSKIEILEAGPSFAVVHIAGRPTGERITVRPPRHILSKLQAGTKVYAACNVGDPDPNDIHITDWEV